MLKIKIKNPNFETIAANNDDDKYPRTHLSNNEVFKG